MALLISLEWADFTGDGYTLGDSLDDANRNRVGRHKPGDPYANPQSGTPVG